MTALTRIIDRRKFDDFYAEMKLHGLFHGYKLADRDELPGEETEAPFTPEQDAKMEARMREIYEQQKARASGNK